MGRNGLGPEKPQDLLCVPAMELEPHPLTCSLHFGLVSIPKAAPLAYAQQEEPWSFQERSVAFLQGHKAAGRMFGFACLCDGDEGAGLGPWGPLSLPAQHVCCKSWLWPLLPASRKPGLSVHISTGSSQRPEPEASIWVGILIAPQHPRRPKGLGVAGQRPKHRRRINCSQRGRREKTSRALGKPRVSELQGNLEVPETHPSA